MNASLSIVSRKSASLVLLAIAVATAGCAGRSSSGSVYTPGQAQREQTVRMGVVESVRQVTIEPQQSGVVLALGVGHIVQMTRRWHAAGEPGDRGRAVGVGRVAERRQQILPRIRGRQRFRGGGLLGLGGDGLLGDLLGGQTAREG